MLQIVMQVPSRSDRHSKHFQFLKSNIKGLSQFIKLQHDKMKRQMCQAIFTVSLQYENTINQLKYRLEQTEQQLADALSRQESQEIKAAELVSDKLEELDELKAKLQDIQKENQRLREAKRSKEDWSSRALNRANTQIEHLNLKINDLLAIIEEKNSRLDTFQDNQRRASTARSRNTDIVIEESQKKNIKKVEYNANSNNKEFNSSARASNLRKYLRNGKQHSIDLEQQQNIHRTHTSTRNNSVCLSKDSEILTKLQQFVSDLTFSHRQAREDYSHSEYMPTFQKSIELKFSPKHQWSNSLRVRDENRRHSSNFFPKR